LFCPSHKFVARHFVFGKQKKKKKYNSKNLPQKVKVCKSDKKQEEKEFCGGKSE